MDAKKLKGVKVDTNKFFIPSIREGQEESALKQITEGGYDLSKLRRVINRKDILFTSYVYHYSETSLGETLEQFLNR